MRERWEILENIYFSNELVYKLTNTTKFRWYSEHTVLLFLYLLTHAKILDSLGMWDTETVGLLKRFNSLMKLHIFEIFSVTLGIRYL